MSVNKIDRAYTVIKYVTLKDLWIQLFKMAIKLRNMSIVKVCITKIKFTRASIYTRSARFKKMNEPTKLAMMAIQLNMLEDAQQILEEACQYDHLIEFLINMAKWDEAENLIHVHNKMKLNEFNFKAG